MKRFIIISLLAMLAKAEVLACYFPGTHNYYLFCTVEQHDWQLSTDRRCTDNWQAYSDGTVSWFDADELRKVARKKGDALMLSYIDHLEKYLEVVRQIQDTWEYPTKQELARRQQVLANVRQYAFSKTKTRLRSQHALLYMRCNMMLKRHAENVTFWEQTASKYINSVYRDMMRNIYAGALLKSGKADDATQIFMEQGDMASLYTYYYKRRSFDAIRQEYLRNPNSPALPFLIQDFANNAQEAIDAQQGSELPGKLFVRDIEKAEAMKMCALAQQVVKEGKSNNPALWKSVEAWLEYLFGNQQKACDIITEAQKLDGTARIKDNARALHLFIAANTQQGDASLDNMLASELTWLEEKVRDERGSDNDYENHYTRVFDRLVHQVLVPRYDAMGRSEVAMAFLSVYTEQPKVFRMLADNRRSRTSEWGWNPDYSDDFFIRIDTIPAEQAEAYLAYSQKKAPTAPLDKWLSSRMRHDDNYLHEIIGTKYLRLAQWAKAEKHLAQVSLDFINTMNIVPFMARRNYQVEPWLNRQRIKEEHQLPGNAKTTSNQKLSFVREMQQLEQGFGTSDPATKAQQAYQLAVRYTQASYAGDAWYLTRYGKSCYDKPRTDEADMLKKADEMLKIAQSFEEFKFQEKVLFAQAYLPIDQWRTEEWSDSQSDFVNVVHRNSHQYRALQALSNFKSQHSQRISPYVSRCDVLKEFMKSQR